MKIKKMELKNGLNHKHRRDNGFYRTFVTCVIDKGQVRVITRTRFYATQNRIYCCFWLSYGNQNASGSGFAGGAGYHKPSMAFKKAIEKAGITFNEIIAGVGDTAIKEALNVITKRITGKRKVFLIIENI